MDTDTRALLLSAIDMLSRHAFIDELFADQLGDMARAIESTTGPEGVSDAMIVMARQHRVGAIKARARMAALSREYEARFEANPFAE